MTEYTVIVDCQLTSIVPKDDSFTEEELMRVTSHTYAKLIDEILNEHVIVDDVKVTGIQVFPFEVKESTND